MLEMNAAGHVSGIAHLVENLQLVDELETDDLFSLKAALQEDMNPEFDSLWELVLARTGSLS